MTFSEVATDTGLSIEEIMVAVGRDNQEAALNAFVASCRTIAASDSNPEFLRLAEEAVETLRKRPSLV